MHRIIGKEHNVDAHCEYNDELLSLDNEIKTLLKNRIQTSFGFHSKSFELVLENDANGSTFSYLRNLRTMSDEVFIDSSKTVANILADSSNRGPIPGGFLLVLELPLSWQGCSLCIQGRTSYGIECYQSSGTSPKRHNIESFPKVVQGIYDDSRGGKLRERVLFLYPF